MTGKTTTINADPWSTTENQKIPIEILQEHSRLKAKFEGIMAITGVENGRVSRALMEEEEVSRSNLRAFERAHGLTS